MNTPNLWARATFACKPVLSNTRSNITYWVFVNSLGILCIPYYQTRTRSYWRISHQTLLVILSCLAPDEPSHAELHHTTYSAPIRTIDWCTLSPLHGCLPAMHCNGVLSDLINRASHFTTLSLHFQIVYFFCCTIGNHYQMMMMIKIIKMIYI